MLCLTQAAWAITYTINPAGTVTDSNGLTWDRCSYGQTGADCSGGTATTYVWAASFGPATVANRGAGYKGHTDWRLPTAAELCTIAIFNGQEGCVGNDSGSATPAKINATVFPNTRANAYWTSQASSASGLGSIAVDFRWATSGPYSVQSLSNVRLVRGGQTLNPFPGSQPTAEATNRTTASMFVSNNNSTYLFVYYVIVPNGSTPPHPAQVIARNNYDGVTLAASGLVQMPPHTSQHVNISNLLAETTYNVYVSATKPNGAFLDTAQHPAPLNVVGPLTFTTYPRIAQNINFPEQAAQNYGVSSFPINPVATGGASMLQVTYSSLSTNICTVSGIYVTPLSVGTCIIAANQAGNVLYAPAPQVTRNITINRGIQTLIFNSDPPNPARIGSLPYTVSAYSNRSLTPVTYSIDTSSSAVCTINAKAVTFIGVGTCRIVASQAGNENYGPAQAQHDVIVIRALSNSNLTASSPTSSPGQSVTFSISVSGRSPTGTATFTANGSTTLCNAVPLTGTQTTTAQCVTSSLPAGQNTIVATYSGNATNEPSTSTPLTHTVARVATTTNVSSACMRTFVENQPFTFSSTVTGSNPSGSISFNSGPNSLCANVPLSSGGASCTTSALAVPSGLPQYIHSLTATYSGDASNTNSTSSPMLITVLGISNVIFRDGMELPTIPCPIM